MPARDVTIPGAGATGLSAAVALAQAGMKVRSEGSEKCFLPTTKSE